MEIINLPNGEVITIEECGDRGIATKHVCMVTVIDPDSQLPVEIEIRKLATGGMVGIDGSFLDQDMGTVFSPYDSGVELIIPDDEPALAPPGWRSV